MQTQGKYLVIKNEDVDEFLTSDMKIRLDRMIRRVRNHRSQQDKKDNKYLVVNQDEPFISSMFRIMKNNGVDIQS